MPSEPLLPLEAGASESGDKRLSALTQACEPGTPSFVLIDPLVGEPIPVGVDGAETSLDEIIRARAAAWNREVVTIDLHSTIDLAPNFHPYLVTLHGADDLWLAVSFALAEAERLETHAQGLAGEGRAVLRIGGWLHSSAHGEQIAQALSENLRVRCEAPVKPRYQRLVDRRALSWARFVVGDARVSATLGPIQRWTYLDATGAVNHIGRIDERGTALQWTAKEWKTIMQGDLVHQTLARYLGELAQREQHTQASERDLLILAHGAVMRVAEAKSRWPSRFSEARDETAWAALLMLHGNLLESSVAQRVLQDAADQHVGVGLHALAPTLNDLLFETRQ